MPQGGAKAIAAVMVAQLKMNGGVAKADLGAGERGGGQERLPEPWPPYREASKALAVSLVVAIDHFFSGDSDAEVAAVKAYVAKDRGPDHCASTWRMGRRGLKNWRTRLCNWPKGRRISRRFIPMTWAVSKRSKLIAKRIY